MKTIIAFLFAIVGIANAAISTATKPHTIDSAVTPKVSYVDDNDEALLDKINEVIDTANIYLGSGVSASVLSTTGDQRLTIDSDNNGTNRWFVTSGGTSDTLLRIIEGGTWKVWGDGTGTKLTLSDSILAATARISGLTASRLMATNADNTLASVSDLTSWVAGTTNQITSTSDGDGSITLSIPNGFTLPSASPTFTGLTLSGNATVGGTLGVTGAVTLSTLSSGRIPVVSTAGLITQDDLYWDAANNRLGIGSGANSPNGDLDIIKSSINGTSDLSVQNSASSGLSHARIYTQVHSGSTGDPYFLANVSGGVAWAFGADNSDSDAFVISEAGNLGTNNRLHIASGGAVTIPGTLGVTGASTLAALSATTGAFSGDVTLSGATGDRVLFTNGYKVASTGGLRWDETTESLGIGFSPLYDLTIVKQTTNGQVRVEVYNQGVGGSEATLLSLGKAATGSGDVSISFTNGTQSYAIGLDDSASDAFVLARSGALGTSNVISVSAAGVVTMSGQTQFTDNGTGITGAHANRGAAWFGVSSGQQIQVDSDELQSMSGTSPTTLYLNFNGGAVDIGGYGVGGSGSGGLAIRGKMVLGAVATAGAGGSDWTNETSVDVSEVACVNLTPTANNQTYRFTNLTTGQVLWVHNSSGSYDLVFDGDGTGADDVYINFGGSRLVRWTGTTWWYA